ncbi:hypothetical protein M9H77_16671 [Catharanthus roseus]|uniref:Uncharacterized protein n=1 Tax=Catharanthus roseus TaxID=4058 RepID=A0ACC0B2T3_CATRO|nr:hypothetical protein M9H77_16671 [Catharanthus roseus]
MPKKKKLARPSNTKDPGMGAQVENEGSDTNVPETSVATFRTLSTSRTLGSDDTLSSTKGEASSDQPIEDPPKEEEEGTRGHRGENREEAQNQSGSTANVECPKESGHMVLENGRSNKNGEDGQVATKKPGKDVEEDELETTPATGNDQKEFEMGDAQKGDKGILKRITSTLVDKGSKRTTGKDKGKMPMGKNEEKGLEKRKGTKQYTLCYKLKKFKRSLKDLNWKHYGHISAKAEVAKSKLKQKHEKLHNNPHDEQLKKMVRELQHKARFLVDAERRFYAQKTKCEFLLEGDRNSKLFYSLAKRNAKRNFIAALTKEDGSRTSSLKEIQEELIRFYGDLLGTKNEVKGFDATIMNEGIFLAGMDEYEKEAIIDLTEFFERNMPFRYLGVPLSSLYLKVVDFAPLLNNVSSTLLTWAGLNLSYAGKLEVISSVVQGIESFGLGVLPISTTVLDRITGMCRRFLWGSNSAQVAWHTMCLSKQEGGLGLRDMRRWNDALLSKAIWNIHAKKDTSWCKWIHHFLIKNGSIWDIHVKKDFPP